jgi:hypothetical protein
MNHTAIVIAVGLALAATLPAAPAWAQNSRSFVSPTGSDSNNCSLATPCRTLAHAIGQTNAGGEIDVLGTAGYGAFSINKAISIVNESGEAGVLATSGNGITIAAGATDAIYLKGLLIEGGKTGDAGIMFTSGGSLDVQDCVIRDFANIAGIVFEPSSSSSLFVSTTFVSGVGTADGIDIAPSGTAAVTALLDRVQLHGNAGIGLSVDGSSLTALGSITGTVSSGTVDRNGHGIIVNGVGGAVAIMVRSTAVVNNVNTGLGVASAIVRLTGSTITGNGTGWSASPSSSLVSYIDNNIDGNTSVNGAPPTTTPLK